MMPEQAASGPFAQAVHLYREAGWLGTLPLPPRAKASPPPGWTGREGYEPSGADIYAWLDGDERMGNIGLRLPRHVIGIDVDHYGAKHGATELAEMVARWGPLPPSWITGSRLETGSGISLFTVAEDRAWPGDPAPSIEIIQHRHRYAVVWPSLHPEGRTYCWQNPSGFTVIGEVPHVDDLPMLPQRWVEGLSTLRGEAEITRDRGLDYGPWLLAHGGGSECAAMRRAIARYVGELSNAAIARHDAAKDGIFRICRLVSEGHGGGMSALAALRASFDAAIKATPKRTDDPHEWERMLEGAVQIAGAYAVTAADPCTKGNEFAGIIAWGAPGAADATVAGGGGTASGAGGASVPESSSAVTERTTWWPIPRSEIFTELATTEPAAFLRRSDGAALLYAGRVNGLIGESESGKSFIALLAASQALADGHNVTYMDFEDSPRSVGARFLALGVDRELMLAHLDYIGPKAGYDLMANQDFTAHLAAHAPRLVIMDGFNAAMSLLSLEINSNDDATTFAQRLLSPVAATGAAVVYVDHVPKNREQLSKGGIGAQAKRAMTDGVILRVEVLTAFGRGQSGEVKLSVDKDRPGSVRGLSASAVAGHAAFIGDNDGNLTISISPPDATETASKDNRAEDGNIKTRAWVSTYLAGIPSKSASKNRIFADSSLGATKVRKAIEYLLGHGYARLDEHGQAHVITLLRPYSELAELIGAQTSSSSQTSSDLVSDEVPIVPPSTSSHPPLKGGRRETRDEVSPDDPDDEELDGTRRRTPAASIQVSLPGGDEQAAKARACIARGGKPGLLRGNMVDLATGELL